MTQIKLKVGDEVWDDLDERACVITKIWGDGMLELDDGEGERHPNEVRLTYKGTEKALEEEIARVCGGYLVVNYEEDTDSCWLQVDEGVVDSPGADAWGLGGDYDAESLIYILREMPDFDGEPYTEERGVWVDDDRRDNSEGWLPEICDWPAAFEGAKKPKLKPSPDASRKRPSPPE